ncbi:uncharacterized protein BP01DRAFT_420876 [Aspergillus saccharolyticus JOP 1030-1]|uniref:DUF202 domain-containing protein n=1 Tax=Aspergillus saccharolyticus JOP 1030-1 TaxID=1450539 RepID=A0A318ZN26_9EURO|nr:hypothetical protein BP01DRAFT_420876 [Aspergillus saccharolyticus JOP 1030-1]PYH48377.1 hypothetical protein BP01DRAFT_420876 [Aspergillus saccharolyticus JOP 1030-1]
MEPSDLTTQSTKNPGASSPTEHLSSPHASQKEPHRMSPPSAEQGPPERSCSGQVQPINECTPIVSNTDSSRRNYQSTEGLRTRESESVNSQAGISERQCARDTDQQPSQSDAEEPQASWYRRMADRYGSLELENKGSVARDHLALERTFLAWLRTSLAFASIGIAVTQLFRLNNTGNVTGVDSASQNSNIDPASIAIASASQRLRSIGKPLGTTFIGVAILILLVGFHRYFESQYWIIRGKFPASRGSVGLIAIVAAALIIATLVVILAISPGAVEA